MKQHELKTDPDVFQAVWDGLKTFEIRYNDRDYERGDTILLRETKHTGVEMKTAAPLEYTGRTTNHRVTYVLHGPVYGLQAGWVILSLG